MPAISTKANFKSAINLGAQSSAGNTSSWKDYQLKMDSFTEFNQTLSAVEMEVEFAALPMQKVPIP